MKLKINILLWAVIALLLVFNISALYKYQKCQKELLSAHEVLKNLSDRDEYGDTSVLKQFIISQQRSEAVSCKFVELKDSKTGQIVPLSSLINGKNTLLFFRFKETSCDACVQQSTVELDKLSAHFPENKIVILSGYSNVRQFNAYAQACNKNFRVMNADSIPVDAENQEQPYFFVVTPDLKIQNVFIVSKGDDKLTVEYLHCMVHKYWENHENCL
jgi:phage gp45-like